MISAALQVYHAFRTAKKTTSVPALAKRFGVLEVTYEGLGKRSYLFPDHSILVTTGRGVSYNIEILSATSEIAR